MAIAALGLMAVVGAGTASATTLSTDAAGTVKYGRGQEIHSTLEAGTSAELLDTSGGLIGTCTDSTILSDLETATGTWVGGPIQRITFDRCSQLTVLVIPGSLGFMQTNGDAGFLKGTETQMTLSVFGVSCVYGTGEGTTLGTIAGGEASKLSIEATLPRISGGFLCPSTSVWHAHYVVTSPHALHFVA